MIFWGLLKCFIARWMCLRGCLQSQKNVERQMRRKSKKGVQLFEEPVVNLTPLIDVVFVVLIMFIVVAPMLELDRVELAKAREDSRDVMGVTHDSGNLAIYVRQDNTIWFQNKHVTAKELVILLKQAKGLASQSRPQVFHDHRAHFGTYQNVQNALEMAGVLEMDIILKPS